MSYANPAFCSQIGKSSEQLIGKRLCDALPAMHDCAALLARVYRSGNPERHTQQLFGHPSSVFWSFRVWPVVAHGKTVGTVIQFTETTDFHEMTVAVNEALVLSSVRQHELSEAAALSNTQLQRQIVAREQAEEVLRSAQERLSNRAGELQGLVDERTSELSGTNRQLEAFVYSIAHDLRAPLRAMQAFSELLVEEAATLSEAGKGYAARIVKSAQFMDALLSDLLAFARVTQRRVELNSVSLEKVTAAVLLRLQPGIENTEARLERSGQWPNVFAHEPTLSQVVCNLVSNALKFAKPGVAPVVRLRAEERGEFIRVWVEDNGVGIPAAYQQQIFGLFSRLNGEKFPGTGIGLAIVQGGVERMGGRVGVESIEQQGSRFWFQLRKADAPA